MGSRALFFAAMLVGGIGSTGALAFPARSGVPAAGLAPTPAAMCGYSCRRGGRYIPGPPSVCYDEGLNYCGPSGGGEGGVGLCAELRRACLFKDELGETGQGNCRRYREVCR